MTTTERRRVRTHLTLYVGADSFAIELAGNLTRSQAVEKLAAEADANHGFVEAEGEHGLWSLRLSAVEAIEHYGAFQHQPPEVAARERRKALNAAGAEEPRR